jgi:hypothetical protein
MSNNPFIKSILTRKVHLSCVEVGEIAHTRENLQRKIAHLIEGKCIAEGYILPHSVKIIRFSSGRIHMEDIVFDVVFECEVCLPVEGMELECKVKTITKAGIHAEFIHRDVPIVTVFIARDDNVDNSAFHKIQQPNATIRIKVTAVTFELNDRTLTVLAELL